MSAVTASPKAGQGKKAQEARAAVCALTETYTTAGTQTCREIDFGQSTSYPSLCHSCVEDAASCLGGTAGNVESRAGGSPFGRNDTMKLTTASTSYGERFFPYAGMLP